MRENRRKVVGTFVAHRHDFKCQDSVKERPRVPRSPSHVNRAVQKTEIRVAVRGYSTVAALIPFAPQGDQSRLSKTRQFMLNLAGYVNHEELPFPEFIPSQGFNLGDNTTGNPNGPWNLSCLYQRSYLRLRVRVHACDDFSCNNAERG